MRTIQRLGGAHRGQRQSRPSFIARMSCENEQLSLGESTACRQEPAKSSYDARIKSNAIVSAFIIVEEEFTISVAMPAW